MTVLKIFLFISLYFIVTYAKISDKRICYDPTCSEPVSLAKTTVRYHSDDSRILSFLPNEKVKIFSKSAGSRADLWGAEINGKRGYVPNMYIRETKMFHVDLKHLVDTEGEDDPINKSAPKIVKNDGTVIEQVNEQIIPNSVTPAYEVIHGTTIYLSSNEELEQYSSTPSSTDNIEQSEKKQVEIETTEPTHNIKPDTKSVVDNLNTNVEEKENIAAELPKQEIKADENIEKIYDLSDQQQTENKEISSQENKDKIEQKVNNVEFENINVEVKENIGAELQKQEIKAYQNIEKNYDLNEQQIKNNEITSKENKDNIEEKVNNGKFENESAETEDVDDEEDEEESDDANEEEEEEDELTKENSENSVKNENINNENNKIVQLSETTSNIDQQKPALEILENKTPEIVTENVETSSETVINPDSILKFEQQISLESSEIVNDAVNISATVITPQAEINSEQIEQVNKEISQENIDFAVVDHEILNNISIHTETEIKNVIDDKKIEELPQNNDELKVEEKVESVLNNEGAPSFFPNPLNFFSSQEVQNEPKVEINTQVPDISTNSNENLETTESETKYILTTEASFVNENPSPFENDESFTENPNILSKEFLQQQSVVLEDQTPQFIDVQPDSSSSKKSELFKDISSSDLSFESRDSEFDNDILNEAQNNLGLGFVEKIISNSMKDQSNDDIENQQNSSENLPEQSGFFSNIFSNIFGSSEPQEEEVINEINDKNIEEMTRSNEELNSDVYDKKWSTPYSQEKPAEKYLEPAYSDMQNCKAGQDSSCPFYQNYIKSENGDISWSYEIPENAYSIFLYLSLTAATVLLFSLGHYYIEKRRKDGRLIANINELEKKLLITTKECQLAQDELKTTKDKLLTVEDTSYDSNEIVVALKEELEVVQFVKAELEEQVNNLENELEKATETGMEMSNMLNQMLTSQSGNEHLMKTIHELQKQLNEQQVTLNQTQSKLNDKTTENELFQTELEVATGKVLQLQSELDKMVVNILSVQEEKLKCETELENQIQKLNTEYELNVKKINGELMVLQEETKKLKILVEETQRSLDIKTNEYDLLKQSMKDIQGNKESLKALLDVSQVKAEVQQLRDEKHKLSDKLQKQIDEKLVFEKQSQVILQEVKILKDKLDDAEKEKVEAETRLEVLSSYFKEREAQLQKEINENESKWVQKEGEASTTIERIKWIQEELQNYKSQNEMLKKEILDQEVSLKSQISMLEKKSHDNWMLARQAERRLEESKQESSQLRNRLTIVEKNLNNTVQMSEDTKLQNRIMSPLESNGEVAVSPLHMANVENPGSPPLLFPHRDHMTTSPPLPGLPPFMPPPPGVPFMPPPLPGVPPFMPPPPVLFPGDHRPPPLGRMSSPPLHGRYSPDSRAYSPYDRDDSPPLSPTYTDDYRRRTPPPVGHMPPRNYSPYSKQRHWDDDRDRDYRGQHHRNKPRAHKGLSSGSGNSNESLENSGRHSGRV